MVKINLLPWREELRQQRQREFLTAIGLGAVLTLSIMAAVHVHIEGIKGYQGQRNQTLKTEIEKVNATIVEIKEFKTKKEKLVEKINKIQELQKSRPQIVHLFDELAKRTPEGVFLTQFKQTGTALVMEGKAQSNARVSAFMREVENSEWLAEPKLSFIKGLDDAQLKADGGVQLSDFTMFAKQGEPKASEKVAEKP